MTQRRQKITLASVAAACSIASAVGSWLITSGRATIAARAEAREFVTEIANTAAAAAVKPVKDLQDEHLHDMALKRQQMDVFGGQVIGALEALCEDASPTAMRKCLRTLKPNVAATFPGRN